jgi:hypothetical protein
MLDYCSGEMSSPLQWEQCSLRHPPSASKGLTRGEIGTLDRGKGVVSNSSHNLKKSRQGSGDVHRTRTRTGTRYLPAIDLSTPPRAPEQESDDFWNEVIREFDNGHYLASRNSYQVLSTANHRTVLQENISGTSRHAILPVAGSSLRELDGGFHHKVPVLSMHSYSETTSVVSRP